MITLDDLRRAEVAVARQTRVVATRRKRLQEEEDALLTLRAELHDRAEQFRQAVQISASPVEP